MISSVGTSRSSLWDVILHFTRAILETDTNQSFVGCIMKVRKEKFTVRDQKIQLM